MDEDAELQAKIVAIAGKINQRKQQTSPQAQHTGTHQQDAQPTFARWSPYSTRGRAGHRPVHQNRTLVLGGVPKPAAADLPHDSNVTIANVTPTSDYISARGFGKKQIMSKNTYERELRARQEHEDKKQLQRCTSNHEHTKQGGTTQELHSNQDRELIIEGVVYRMRVDGSKLTRVSPEDTKETPKQIKIADVDFFRTKNGNLIRVKPTHDPTRSDPNKTKPQCELFTKHGTCTFGKACRFAHDPEKVAICKTFLLKGVCAAGDNCDLSHDLTYYRVSACTHFLRGNCTNDACRYPHVRVSPASPVCSPFALLGYCPQGPDCGKRHVVECPDYANTGRCLKQEKGTCPLPHPERASTLRKAAKQAKESGEEDSDVASDVEVDVKVGDATDIDSDDSEDVIMHGTDGADDHALTQQQDFIAFS